MAIGWKVASRVLVGAFRDQYGLIAAGVAFYALLAAVPAIAALMALTGLVTDSEAVVSQLEQVSEILPEEAAAIIIDQAQQLAGASDEGLTLTLIVGVGFAIYLSTRATTGMIHGLNVANGVEDKRGMALYWLTVILLTAAGLFGAALLLVLLVVLPVAIALIPDGFGSVDLLIPARWAAVFLVFFAGTSLLFRFAPAKTTYRSLRFTPGSLLAVVLWFAGSVCFAVYVANFGNYNETFGSLGGVIILLTWLWLSAFVVLVGALLDAEIDRSRR